jgi:flagellar FliL protein
MATAVSRAKPAEPAEPEADAAAKPAKDGGGGKRGKLLLLAVPVVLAVVAAGLWFGGILPPLLGAARPAAEAEAKAALPAFVDLPEIVANLNAGARRNSYVKLRARLELAKPQDDATLKAAVPRLLDLFQTYLREMRPEELRGSAGSYRLREELIARANLALAPIRVTDVLFTEMLIQ